MDTRRPYDNPFTPSFGEVPKYMAGRGDIIGSLVRAFDADVRSPYLASLITGARGTGKTALMLYAANEAARRGWITVRTVASAEMLDDIYERSVEAAAHILGKSARREISGVSVGGVGVQWRFPEEEASTWRTRMNRILDELAAQGAGLLICVDEIDPRYEEVGKLANTYQLFVGEQRKVGLIMAGLPRSVSQLISGESTSFLRRAQKISLGRIPDLEVASTIRKTIEDAGKTIGEKALESAVRTAQGYPYMLQLVGYHLWEEAGTAKRIDVSVAQKAAEHAHDSLKHQVLGPTYYELSEGDKAFLRAMLRDEDVSSLGEIAQRMGKSNSYAAQYKLRLLDAGVIGEDYNRYLHFELPGMREFVEEMR